MTRVPLAPRRLPHTVSIRIAGAALVAVWAALIAAQPAWVARLATTAFDAYQNVSPRPITSLPATIVAIDDRSVAAVGRWPWPRTRLAQLVEAIARSQPAAIGIDIFMPEPDPLSFERLLAQAGVGTTAPVANVESLLSNDKVLATALAASPTVLAFAAATAPTGLPLRVAAFSVQGDADDPDAIAIPRFAGALSSLDELNRAASGWGLVSVVPEQGVIRRVPLVASIDGTLVPAFALDVLRVAYRFPSLRLLASGTSATGIALGSLAIPTEPDGAARVHFSPHDGRRFVSAVDVLEGRADADRLRQRLVIIAATAVGLGDFHATPLGEWVPGSEVHAQLLESVFDGSLLVRPGFAPLLEAAVFALLGAVLVWTIPAWSPRNATLALLACVAIAIGGAWLAFLLQRTVLDAATPATGLLLVFATLLLMTLAESLSQRRALEHVVQMQRERAARIAGELEAARRIQLASLPNAASLLGDPRVDLAATMRPALEVGGDLYDFFRLDEHRLFLLVGDVAGKGVSASIFMAVSKALCKSTMLRTRDADIGWLVAEANAEVSRDNPEMMFVTAFAAVLDLRTGDLDYCNAGHENPFVVALDGNATVLDEGGGPPLCTVDGFDYRGARYRMRDGEMLCLVSDGVTDMQDRSGAMYGRERAFDLLRRTCPAGIAAHAVVDRLLADVDAFAAGTVHGDDVTVLALRFRDNRP